MAILDFSSVWLLGLRRRGSASALIALSVAGLAACTQIPLDQQDEPRSPDVLDSVRNLDLLPRYPKSVDSSARDTGPRATPQVYEGVVLTPLEDTRPASGGTKGQGPPQGYELNFENTPVASVAKVVLGDILGTGYTVDPRVQGTINLASGRPVPRSDLLFVLENALRLNGIVLVRDTAGYRLVPLGDAVGGGNVDSAAARAEPGYGISVVPLQYVSASTLIKLLDSFATKPGTVRADTARNMLLIQGSGAERRTAIETVLSFDADWMRGQSVGIFPVQYSNPEPIITELEKIMDTTEGGLSQNVIKFQVVARQNAILVVSRKPNLLRTAETWIKRLDKGNASRNGVHVYRIKYGEARQLARVLNDVFVGSSSSNSFDTAANQVAPRSGLSGSSSIDRPTFGSQAGAAGQPSGSASGFGRAGGDSRGFGGTASTLGTTQVGGTGAGAGQQGPARQASMPARPRQAAGSRCSKASGSPRTCPPIRSWSMPARRITGSSKKPCGRSTSRNCRSASTRRLPRSRSTTVLTTGFNSFCRARTSGCGRIRVRPSTRQRPGRSLTRCRPPPTRFSIGRSRASTF